MVDMERDILDGCGYGCGCGIDSTSPADSAVSFSSSAVVQIACISFVCLIYSWYLGYISNGNEKETRKEHCIVCSCT